MSRATHEGSSIGIPRRRESGQVLVVFALSVTSMLAVIGLMFTFGQVLAQRRMLQTAADAASLRGSWAVLQELASDNRQDSVVLAAVRQFASLNGLRPDGVLSAFYLDANGLVFSPVSVQVGQAPGGAVPYPARGVQVTVSQPVASILPGFVKVLQTGVQAGSSATAEPTTLAAAGPVVPIAARWSDVQSAFGGHPTYDLFGSNARTLDLTTSKTDAPAANPAPGYGLPATNARFWSDGQHSGTWQMTQPGTVDLANADYHAEIAAGLHDNVARQALPTDATGATYALVMVPVYDTATAPAAHIIGFAQFKIRDIDIKICNNVDCAKGTFVPFATAAYGTTALPAFDVGSVLVSIVS